VKTALLIGQNPDAMRPFPFLLSRMGVNLRVISLTKAFYQFHPNCTVQYFDHESQALEALKGLDLDTYSWIFLADDHAIDVILRSNLADYVKEKLLPVISKRYWSHLNSKIGLMQCLQNSKVRMPISRVARNQFELLESAQKLGFPLFIKRDFSSGGRGVIECSSLLQLKRAMSQLGLYPVLMQQKLYGPCLDLSGFFQNGELVHFSYSRFKSTAYSPFGPSILRTYHQLSQIDPAVIQELRELGRSLGLHGFANISCIEAEEDCQRYYFEVDARANAWIDYGRYIGEDIAPVMAKYLQDGSTFNDVPKLNFRYPEKLLIPNFLRLSIWEILFNRFECWGYIDNIRFTEIILYNVLRRTLGWLEARLSFLESRLNHLPFGKNIETLYATLKRKAVGFF